MRQHLIWILATIFILASVLIGLLSENILVYFPSAKRASEAIAQNTCLTSPEGLWHDVLHPLKTHQSDREVHPLPLPWL